MIAALYVEKNGCYAHLPDVELWPASRDARFYRGPHSIVAHPPCQLWGRFAKINYIRWGGEHNRPGNDNGCFAAALSSLCIYGGVLEHPAFSDAWKAYDLPCPVVGKWTATEKGLHVCEVWQSAYGHLARKRTWLLYFGRQRPPPMRWNRPAAEYQIGFHDQRGKERNKPTISGKRASATPVAFAQALVNLAQGAM